MSITPNLLFFFFNDTATTEIYTLSLHDALPIYDHRGQTIEKIRTAIVRLVHYDDGRSDVNLSSYLADELHADYSSLSKLFSEVVGVTIERYFILQRIERVKELLCYDELTLSQIALQMHYSSTAYLSSQFKSVTGMTPSQFKKMHENSRTRSEEHTSELQS